MSRLTGIAACFLAILAVAQANAETATSPSANDGTSATDGASALFTEDDLLLFDTTAGGLELTDSLPAYSSRAGIFLPLGQLSRLLDLSIIIDPPAHRAEGWILSPDRPFVLDLKTAHASVSVKDIDAPPTEAIPYNEDIYVRSDLMQKLLPIKLKINKSDLVLEIVTLEHFPFQERLERERLRNGLRNGNGNAETIMHVPASYELFTPPSVDLNLQVGGSNRAPHATTVWEARLGGDIAYSGLQLFAGSDDDGGLSSVRTLFERKDPDGLSAGIFGATRSDAGDVYTPSLALGVASTGGRGVTTTSQALDQASVFSTTDIRGELPLGYEVELYVNEVLRGSQAVPVRGNYEFLSVSLSYGLNVIRLVFYGPRGERREEIRRINVGSGQLQAGQTVYSFGVTQEGIPLIDINRADNPPVAVFGVGSMRIVGAFEYGLNEDITLTSGIAQYTPNASYDHREHELATAGLLTSLAGFALEFDAAVDSYGGLAEAVGFGGRVFDVSLVARHSEYFGGFVDELQTRDMLASALLERSSDLSADWSVGVPFTELMVPVSVHAQRSQYIDGAERMLGDARLSAAIGRYLVSAGWQYEELRAASGITTPTSTGTLDASALVWQSWQVRAAASFGAEPNLHIDSAGILVDGTLAENNTARFGVSHSFESDEQTQLQGTTTWSLSHFDISLNANYTPETSEARFGIQFAIGALFDPLEHQYRVVRPGAAAGGNVALRAFIDKNGNGKRDDDERPVTGLVAQAGNRRAISDDDGEALITGLGDGAHARVQVDPESINDPYLVAPTDVIELVPHPGHVTVVAYPLKSLGEVAFKIMFSREGASPRRLSALQLQLVTSTGEVIAEGRSEFDGALILERLPAGTYSVRIEPAQAGRLKLKLASNVMVTIPTKGGYAGQFLVNVIVITSPDNAKP